MSSLPILRNTELTLPTVFWFFLPTGPLPLHRQLSQPLSLVFDAPTSLYGLHHCPTNPNCLQTMTQNPTANYITVIPWSKLPSSLVALISVTSLLLLVVPYEWYTRAAFADPSYPISLFQWHCPLCSGTPLWRPRAFAVLLLRQLPLGCCLFPGAFLPPSVKWRTPLLPDASWSCVLLCILACIGADCFLFSSKCPQHKSHMTTVPGAAPNNHSCSVTTDGVSWVNSDSIVNMPIYIFGHIFTYWGSFENCSDRYILFDFSPIILPFSPAESN